MNLHLRAVLVASVLLAAPAAAQDFDSGSTGADGDLIVANSATRNIVLPPDGVLNYGVVTIGTNANITFTRNARNTPVYMLVQRDVVIGASSVIHLEGTTGTPLVTIGINQLGGIAGPGGFDGGSCKTAGGVKAGGGLGPGGGLGDNAQPGGGGASPIRDGAQGIGGAAGGRASSQWHHLVLHGGSGGGCGAGFAGGGGAGAITIASSTRIELNGTITATGGPGSRNGVVYTGGFGGGGMVRLISDRITGAASGRIDVGPGICNNAVPGTYRGGCGGSGLVRLEAADIVGDFLNGVVPLDSLYYGAARPALPAAARAATLRVTQVTGPRGGDQVVGDVNQADHPIKRPVLYLDDEADVTVTVAATNVPLGTRVIVRAKPLNNGAIIEAQSTPLAGELAASTATATFQLPNGVEIGTIEAHIPEAVLP